LICGNLFEFFPIFLIAYSTLTKCHLFLILQIAAWNLFSWVFDFTDFCIKERYVYDV